MYIAEAERKLAMIDGALQMLRQLIEEMEGEVAEGVTGEEEIGAG
jgi:hypothetical protein